MILLFIILIIPCLLKHISDNLTGMIIKANLYLSFTDPFMIDYFADFSG
jgi:hypothetical protein